MLGAVCVGMQSHPCSEDVDPEGTAKARRLVEEDPVRTLNRLRLDGRSPSCVGKQPHPCSEDPDPEEVCKAPWLVAVDPV